MLGVALTLLGAVTVVGVLGSPLLAKALTLGVPADVSSQMQSLVTFLLCFFVPQVLLYAAGTVAIAVLYAKRHFAVTAAAPIGNTVVMVACLIAFRVVAGPNPGLDLSLGERLLLVAAGTGGVVAFVGILLGVRAVGFRLRPATRGAIPGWGGAAPGWGWCCTPAPACCSERPSWRAPRSRAASWRTSSAG